MDQSLMHNILEITAIIFNIVSSELIENATSWTEAESYCRSNKTSQIQTLSIRDFGLNSELHDIVIRYEKNAVLWTGLKRRTYPEWNSGKFTDIEGAPGKNCLYINNHRIQETSCLTSDVTAICGPEDCSYCHRKHCVRYKEQCYYLIFGVNWYEARYHCKDMSLNLVEISDTSLIKYITDEGYNKLSKFWTAYHKEDWVIISPGKQGEETIDESYWHPAASHNDSNNTDCAVSEIKPSGSWWRPVNCDEKHGFICDQDQQSFGSTTASENTVTNANNQEAVTDYDKVDNKGTGAKEARLKLTSWPETVTYFSVGVCITFAGLVLLLAVRRFRSQRKVITYCPRCYYESKQLGYRNKGIQAECRIPNENRRMYDGIYNRAWENENYDSSIYESI